jgi:hypothetical protein
MKEKKNLGGNMALVKTTMEWRTSINLVGLSTHLNSTTDIATPGTLEYIVCLRILAGI